MKRSRKSLVAITVALGLGLGAAAVVAQPGPMGGMSPQMKGSMHAKGGVGHGPGGAQQQLLSPEERSAFQDSMRNAKTPEERQRIAQANRAEIEKRAKEQGITLPGPHGSHGSGPFSGPSTR